MRFAVLGSGSSGNATLIEAGATRVLLDCGFSLRGLEARLASVGVEAASLSAVVLTHEHGDHVGGVARLASRYRLPVWATPGTWRGAGCPEALTPRLFLAHGPGFRVGDLYLHPFPVPHDAREPSQFVVEGAGRRLGVLTDTGEVTARIQDALRDCDGLILETNHDPDLLAGGPYPPPLRARVAGRFGHLSNAQAAAALARLNHPRLRALVLAHLSARNNRPELARAAVLAVDAGLAGRLSIAGQDGPGDWLAL